MTCLRHEEASTTTGAVVDCRARTFDAIIRGRRRSYAPDGGGFLPSVRRRIARRLHAIQDANAIEGACEERRVLIGEVHEPTFRVAAPASRKDDDRLAAAAAPVALHAVGLLLVDAHGASRVAA